MSIVIKELKTKEQEKEEKERESRFKTPFVISLRDPRITKKEDE